MAHGRFVGRPSRMGTAIYGRGIAWRDNLGHRRAKKTKVSLQFLFRSRGVHVLARRSLNATANEAVTPSQTQPCGVGWAGLQRLGPRAAQRALTAALGDEKDKKKWVEDAKLHAILGSMGLSLDALISGLRCYVAFVGRSLNKAGDHPV